MKILIIVLSFLVVLTTTNAQDEAGSIEYEGKTRNYEVYLPKDHHPNMPLVLALHGYSETIKWFKDYTLFHEIADTSGFILAYPQGSIASNGQPGWNTGLRNHPFGQQNTTSNDVGFLLALIDTLGTHYDIDLDRVYCCGYSMGGEMSYRMAIVYGHLFAAYASVSGKLNDISATLGPPLRSYPILHFHGTDDNVETYDGQNDGNLWPVEETMNYWLDNNNCAHQADTISLPDSHPNDGSTVQKISYKNCLDESNVVFYKIINGGHGWPGSTEGIYPGGKPNRDINASSIILNFFKDYQNPLVNLAYGKSIQCYPKFISPQNNNTINLVANIHNPEHHELDVHATILLGDSVITDSIRLYDDGLHNDESTSDNIYGSKKQFIYLEENIYRIELNTNDVVDSISLICPSKDYFITAGPVKWKKYDIKQQNDSLYSMKVTLQNNGTSFTVPDISARLSTSDSNITDILSNHNPQFYPDIEPGQSVQCTGTYGYVFYSKNHPDIVDFTLNIYSNNILYWTYTFMVDLLTEIEVEIPFLPKEFTLSQNYPNPFNPTTTIKYSIPSSSVILSLPSRQAGGAKNLKDFSSQTSPNNGAPQNDNLNVSLKVYDILGREVATLANQKQKPGGYEVVFNCHSGEGRNLTSGIYFYRLQSGDFIETRKMVLIK